MPSHHPDSDSDSDDDTSRDRAARELRDELRSVADEVRSALAEVVGEVSAAADEIAEEIASAKRALTIVWGIDDPPRRGPKATLTRDAIVTAAVELADGGGLDAVSMRSVAKQLGVGTMSLYRHVPGKNELLTLMVDRVNGESVLVGDLPGTWREKLEATAWSEWAIAHAHPWMLAGPVTTARPVSGPNGLAAFESILKAASETGLPPREAFEMVMAVILFTEGVARSSIENALASARTGISNKQWWEIQGEVMEQVFDPERYPTFAMMMEAGVFGDVESDEYRDPIDFTAVFAAGLGHLLDGIEAHVGRHATATD